MKVTLLPNMLVYRNLATLAAASPVWVWVSVHACVGVGVGVRVRVSHFHRHCIRCCVFFGRLILLLWLM